PRLFRRGKNKWEAASKRAGRNRGPARERFRCSAALDLQPLQARTSVHPLFTCCVLKGVYIFWT
ncbi:MAG: hypothetical protein BJ554DRAFT_1893, partial [Olpidium bornovanus]